MNRKKIAFCFSWQARTLDFTYQYFENKLFKPAKEQWFDYDIFCAVEDDKDYWKVEKYLKPTRIKKIKSSEVAKDIEKRYWDFIRKNQGKKFYFYNTKRYSIVNWLQQWYKIYESNNLKSEYEKEQWFEYDIVVRLRFDLVFINKINFISVLKKIKKWIIFNKAPWKLDIIYDNFAFWDSKNMNMYSYLYYNFINVLKKEFDNDNKYLLVFYLILNILLKLQYMLQFLSWLFESVIFKITNFLMYKQVIVFTYERYMYYNIKYFNINCIYTNISFNIYRASNELTWKNIYNITEYEY